MATSSEPLHHTLGLVSFSPGMVDRNPGWRENGEERTSLEEVETLRHEAAGPEVGFKESFVELIAFVDLQASGKSTFFCERFAGTHEHVSKDLFRHNRNKSRRQEELLRAALSAGHSVVVDNTNPTPEERRPLVELGREYGAKVVGYYFDTSVRECLRHNARRAGKAQVPDVAIYATAKKLVPLAESEGFDELYRVRLVGQAFEVATNGPGN